MDQSTFETEVLTNQLFEDIICFYDKILNENTKDQVINSQNKVQLVSNCFKLLSQVISAFLEEYQDLQIQYNELEKQLIQKEAETRKHFQIEQQIKLYAESLEESNDDLQKQLDKLQSDVIELKKNNIKNQRINKPERLMTDYTQEKLTSLISQQKAFAGEKQQKINQKQQTLLGHKLKIARTSTIYRNNEIQYIQNKQYPQRASSINIHDQPRKSQNIRPKVYSVYD